MSETENTLTTLKSSLFDYVRLTLGDQIIDLELDPEHFEAAYNYTIKVYRQRAQNANIEAYTLLTIIKNVDTYTLPAEFVNVRSIFRRTVGLETGPSSTSFDPFSSAILNTYLLNYNYAGGLATYDFYTQYVELAARMFGGFINYTWNPVTKQIGQTVANKALNAILAPATQQLQKGGFKPVTPNVGTLPNTSTLPNDKP
mgnify:CR=1 FL=1